VRIVLGSFIFTGRSASWANTLRRAYFRFVLGRTDLAIVHSRLEVERYRAIFAAPRTRFVFIPWGTTVALRQTVMGDARIAPGEGGVVAAGKSGRDYRTLFAAMADVPAELRVICDYAGALAGAAPGKRTTILADCHGLDYFTELARAAVVAIPLAVEDISAGQMVLVQSMGLGKAIVISRTPTTCDYVTDGHDALLVPCGDAAAMREAILKLLGDRELRVRLGSNARARFDAELSTEGHLRRLLAAIAEPG
jgi:glycosyltransferase involved in cell wall biosynthesis